MKNPLVDRLNVGFYILLLLYIYSCGEKVEGCLDPYSTNFDIDADLPCADCCEYPVLNLSVSHYWDSLNSFRYDDPLFEDVDSLDTIFINQLGFYLSAVKFHSGADSAGVSSSFTIFNTLGNELLLESSYQWYNQSSAQSSSLGLFSNIGQTIDAVSMWIGYDPALGVLDPIGQPSGSPVSINPDSLNWSSTAGLLTSYMNFSRQGALEQDSIGLEFTESHYFYQQLDEPVNIELGSDASLQIRLYYANLLHSCDLINADINQIKNCVSNNLTSSFKVISLE